MRKMNRDFKGVWIPAEMWLDENLSKIEVILLSEIASLDKSNECYASNAYFAKFLRISRNRVSEIIGSLIKKGYLSAKYERNGMEVTRRVLGFSTRWSENREGVVGKSTGGWSENREVINTKNINTINNTVASKESTVAKTSSHTNIFKIWIKANIIKHKKITTKMKTAIDRSLKDYSELEILHAINNYYKVLNSEEHYFNYKWTLEHFLKRGLTMFLDEADPMNNFKKNKERSYD